MMSDMERQPSIDRDALTQMYRKLADDIDLKSSTLISQLISAKTISINDKERVMHEVTSHEKAAMLLDIILRKKAPGCVEAFIKELRIEYSWLHRDITTLIAKIKRERFHSKGNTSGKKISNFPGESNVFEFSSSQTDEKLYTDSRPGSSEPVENSEDYNELSVESEANVPLQGLQQEPIQQVRKREACTQISDGLQNSNIQPGRYTILCEKLESLDALVRSRGVKCKCTKTGNGCISNEDSRKVRHSTSIGIDLHLREDPLDTCELNKVQTLPANLNGLSCWSQLPDWASPETPSEAGTPTPGDMVSGAETPSQSETRVDNETSSHEDDSDVAVKSIEKRPPECMQVSDDNVLSDRGAHGLHAASISSYSSSQNDTNPTEGPSLDGFDEVDFRPNDSGENSCRKLQRKVAVRYRCGRSTSNVERGTGPKLALNRKSNSADDTQVDILRKHVVTETPSTIDGTCTECGRYRRSMLPQDANMNDVTFCACKLKRGDSDAVRENREIYRKNMDEFVQCAPILFKNASSIRSEDAQILNRQDNESIDTQTQSSCFGAISSDEQSPICSTNLIHGGTVTDATDDTTPTSTESLIPGLTLKLEDVHVDEDCTAMDYSACSNLPIITRKGKSSKSSSKRKSSETKKSSLSAVVTGATAIVMSTSTIPAHYQVCKSPIAKGLMESVNYTHTALLPPTPPVSSPEHSSGSESGESGPGNRKKLCRTPAYPLTNAASPEQYMQNECYHVRLCREPFEGFGLKFMKGYPGRERFPLDDEYFITRLIHGTAAGSDDQLSVKDTIVSINGADIRNKTSEEVKYMFKQALEVRMVLRRFESDYV